MSLFDMFSKPTEPAAPTPATPTPTPTPANPGNIPPNVDPNATPAPGSPATPATPAKPAVPDSPLDQFSSLWEPVTNENGDTSTPDTLDPAKLQELVKSANFTSGLNPESLAAIQAGGEGAVTAFTDSLNTVAQQVLMQATLAANQMQEHKIKTELEKQAATIPDMIRSQSLSNNLKTANPVFSNPAVTPIMEAVQSQLAAKNPNATADELTVMTQDFVSVLGEAFSPKAPSETPASEDIDWSKFLSNS